MKRYVVRIALLLVGATAALPAVAQNKDLAAIAATERAFAAMAVKERWQTAFITYFADDGIGFGPHPERTKEVLQKRGVPTTPRTIVFNWAPQFGDISGAGDMGYSTGPVQFTDVSANPKPPWHGMYFSVWQKQADGTWRVAIDIGVDTPQAVAPIETKFTQGKVFQAGRKEKWKPLTEENLASLDDSLSKFIKEHGMTKAYANKLERRQFRVHRKGQMPIVSEEKLIPIVSSHDSFTFLGGKISRSNDLAFTYGKYLSAANGTELETGYYVHVWRRDAAGEWKLVVDVQNPLPKPAK